MVETLKFGNLKWHHILNPSDEDIDYLLDEFHFHPLDIEDCMSTTNQRPKIDVYDDYYFLILHFPYFDKLNKFLRIREIKIFWGEDYIITIGKTHWTIREMFDEAKQSLQSEDGDEEFIFESSDQLLYQILERVMEETYKLVRRIGIGIDYINTDMFDNKADKSIENISVSRKNVILLNTTFKPQVRLFHKFESGDIKGYADNMEEYWGNILDYVQKIWDMTEDFGELIESLSKTFDSMQANRTNEIIKILTFFSSVLLPLTFITGLYGMNVDLPFSQSNNAFFLLIGVMVITVVGMLIFFKRKHWL
ncbi:magnesium transporter CorA family protein [Bacteroidales bacterium OttesenSCG-928-K03]|nr:magnesium transporter CorA family protein [Odoribacter sp. OttesenSCG-928-L07]MDL2241218.1 magnesium transporter CorA family protein [Bacteroidales bacterium OttesenSCG-928-K22]MDL2242817.1 magnesium transporter CorA family protein [Bacteroidales bacterium OttesenSCG-928-K03]